MAKKKVNHQSKPSQEQIPQHQEQTPMDDSSEKLQSLKSLNTLLLKETHERRQQVEKLVKSQETLESELTRSVATRNLLDAELTRLSDEAFGLELEKSLVGIFMHNQMSDVNVAVDGLMREKMQIESRLECLEREFEMLKSERDVEIRELVKKVDELKDDTENEKEASSRVMREKDEMKYQLDLQIKEANGLREKVAEVEESEKNIRDEVHKLKMDCKGLMEEKEDRERTILSLKKDKDSVEKGLTESGRVIADLKMEIGKTVRQKMEIEEDRIVQAAQINELKKEVSRLNESVVALRDEEESMRVKYSVLEKSNAEAVEQREQMLIEFNALQTEKREKERDIENLLEEKKLITKSLENFQMELKKQKQNVEDLVREKSEIAEERNGQLLKINELEKEVSHLNNSALVLRAEEEKLRAKLCELDKNNVEAVEQQEQMLMEFNALQKEKKEKERDIEKLVNEKNLITKDLEKSLNELEDEKQNMEGIVREKGEIEEVKARLQSELFDLQKEVGELRDTLFTLQGSSKDHIEENKRLQSEVVHYRDVVSRVTVERDVVQKGFDEEKKDGSNLRLKVSEMEKSIMETLKQIELLRSEHENLVEEKRSLENRFELLAEEKDSVQKSLVKAQQETDDMQAKMKSVYSNWERVLTMLKSTALVCMSNNDKDGRESIFINEQKSEEVFKPYVTELESIKNAFKGRENKEAEMKRQLDLLQNSEAVAHKQKSFWTFVSSATTLLAAASVAYVARGR